jgi:hypothetical protein
MGRTVVTDEGDRYHLPRLEGESANVAPGTPLALIGLWVAALRSRFASSPAEPLPWVWVENLQPDENEDGFPPPEGEPRKVFIGAAFDVEKSVRNYRPAIYVDRGDIKVEKPVINNFVGQYTPQTLKAYFTQAHVPITFYCESENAGESSLLADTAWFYVLATRDLFRKDFGLYDITNAEMGRTTPHTEDKEVWVTPVSFLVTLELRWSTKPIAPLLREIAMKIEERSNPDEFYHEIVLRDLRK